MPIGWFPTSTQATPSTITNTFAGEEVTTTADHFRLVGDEVAVFDGHVQSVHLQDIVTADHLEVHSAPKDEYFIARGHVTLTDPDGILKASELRISWNELNRFARANQVFINMAGVKIRAESADLVPERWTFYNYHLTPDPAKRPLFEVKGEKLTITPGKSAIAQESDLYFLGQRILGFKSRYFGLDSRTVGFHYPTPEYRPGKGFGYNWVVGSIIAPDTGIQLHSDAAARELPGYGALLTKSFVPTPKDVYPIAPRSELALRFDFGYMDNLFTNLPSTEIGYIDRPRQSLSAETIYNAGVSGRGFAGEVVGIPASLTYEVGGKLGDSHFMTDLKLEDIDTYRDSYITRGEWLDSLELPPQKLGPNLFGMTRIDTGLYQSTHTFLWGRGIQSLIYQPNSNLTLGGAVFAAFDAGRYDFDFDPLYYRDGFALRADYRLGPRKLSVMSRYDTKRSFFDYEYEFTQAMGPLQAFVTYRQYPGDSHFGVMLRVDQIQDLLKRRNWKKAQNVAGIGLP